MPGMVPASRICFKMGFNILNANSLGKVLIDHGMEGWLDTIRLSLMVEALDMYTDLKVMWLDNLGKRPTIRILPKN